jgi:hypothetical protein
LFGKKTDRKAYSKAWHQPEEQHVSYGATQRHDERSAPARRGPGDLPFGAEKVKKRVFGLKTGIAALHRGVGKRRNSRNGSSLK